MRETDMLQLHIYSLKYSITYHVYSDMFLNIVERKYTHMILYLWLYFKWS